MHHSDRGVQYASGDYVRILAKHQVIPSMSRPANPYDNASCESFLKTLKREEIYASSYEDLEHLRGNIGIFIEQYYNQQRLHSALGYRSPEETAALGWFLPVTQFLDAGLARCPWCPLTSEFGYTGLKEASGDSIEPEESH